MKHGWFTSSNATKRLWTVLAIVLGAVVVIDLFVERHAAFGPEGIIGFGAVFGFLSCAVLVAIAKAIGMVLTKPDTYYHD